MPVPHTDYFRWAGVRWAPFLWTGYVLQADCPSWALVNTSLHAPSGPEWALDAVRREGGTGQWMQTVQPKTTNIRQISVHLWILVQSSTSTVNRIQWGLKGTANCITLAHRYWSCIIFLGWVSVNAKANSHEEDNKNPLDANNNRGCALFGITEPPYCHKCLHCNGLTAKWLMIY